MATLDERVLGEATDPAFSFLYIDIAAVDSAGLVSVPQSEILFAEAPSRARRTPAAGAVVVSTVRTYLGAIAQVPVSSRPLVFSTGFAPLQAADSILPRFLYFACRSERFMADVVRRSVGVSYPAISPSELMSVQIDVPPLPEQERIADFLDDQVARIDSLVTASHQQQGLVWQLAYSKMAASVLGSSAVKVPVRRLVASERLGAWGEEPDGGSDDVFCARVADFTRPTFSLGDVTTRRQLTSSAYALRALMTGDILLERSGGTDRNPVGCAVRVNELPGPTVCSNFVSRIRAAARIDSGYLAMVFAALYCTGQQRPHSTQTTGIQNLDTTSYFSVAVPCPAENEQRSISEELSRALEQSQSVALQIDTLVSRLNEYKRSLITAAVSGEFDVSTASARGAPR